MLASLSLLTKRLHRLHFNCLKTYPKIIFNTRLVHQRLLFYFIFIHVSMFCLVLLNTIPAISSSPRYIPRFSHSPTQSVSSPRPSQTHFVILPSRSALRNTAAYFISRPCIIPLNNIASGFCLKHNRTLISC